MLQRIYDKDNSPINSKTVPIAKADSYLYVPIATSIIYIGTQPHSTRHMPTYKRQSQRKHPQ